MNDKSKTRYPVSFVGTGPGDPELLTVKAKKRIEEADIIFYDCLPATHILKEAAPGAEIMYVNKHPEKEEEKQNILDIVEAYWEKGCKVVRLKAGDAMMFNGGDVEAREMNRRGISFELIPGITAACAASNIFAIPTTEIYKSNAIVHLIAFDIPDNYAHIRDVAKLFKSGTTVVLYMAYDNLQRIFEVFQEEGVPSDIPVAIASMVSLSDEDCALTTMDAVFETIEKREMLSPFVFFVGQHVDIYASPKSRIDKLNSFVNKMC
ncbi:MAG: hypothetical protein LBR34_07915 [Prevotella sp.]|jgi:siroheme synthase|nr:hypothetical protein [Prevotella sp.]